MIIIKNKKQTLLNDRTERTVASTAKRDLFSRSRRKTQTNWTEQQLHDLQLSQLSELFSHVSMKMKIAMKQQTIATKKIKNFEFRNSLLYQNKNKKWIEYLLYGSTKFTTWT